ncbi:MAG: carboxymuconolactone decarboxylase family protein [Candidatus Rokubacteria bacterium]|nr:carboxymuconolactone decarboxylase family protein [Candidatus Rokubacteria bacterium]
MALDNRTTELVAIGASITANCLPCLEYHVAKAVESGVDEGEIAQAIDVGTMVRKGAADKMDQLMERLRRPAFPAPRGSTARCCG